MTPTRYTEAEYDAITEAAAQWCMRLNEPDCTRPEREAFAVWLAADPLHAQEYAAMLEIWDVAEHLPHPAPVKAPTPARTQPRSRWQRLGMAAAIVALALPLAGYGGWFLGWVPNAYERLQADTRIQNVTLPDGSTVELNLGTQLTFSNYRDQRRVTLDKGEAFFNVSHSVGHPFVVKAGEGRIRVTGTRFNVWRYEDQVRVNLLEGSVLVTSNTSLSGDGQRLEPGMQARYKAGDIAPKISQSDPQSADLAWRKGKLVLDNLTLAEALPLINRYLNTPLALADNATGQLRIGGVFNTSQVNHLVATLPKVLPVYLTRNQDGNPVLNTLQRN